MKMYHFILIFILIAIPYILISDIKTNDFKAVVKNKKQIDQNLDTAMDDGVTSLVQLIDKNIIINKDEAVNSFFISLEASFGVLDDKENREKLGLYVPVVIVTMENGYYIFYSDEYKNSGRTYISKRWSERQAYSYEDNDFIYGFTLGNVITIFDKNGLLEQSQEKVVYQGDYRDLRSKPEYAALRDVRPDSFLLSDEAFLAVRKNTILSCLEDSMAYYTSRHNRIAQQYGITYHFAFPSVKEWEWEGYLDNNSMFSVFQGYPYGDEAGETYNRFTSAASKISKDHVYYLEQKDWYKVYHKPVCTQIETGIIVIRDEPYFNEESCVQEGAYACPLCIRNGIYAPDIAKDFLKTNAGLSSLVIESGASLLAEFDTTILTYNVNVLFDTPNFNVMPVSADANAVITVNGSNILSGCSWNAPSPQPGQTNLVTVKVSVPGKTDTIYIMNVIRASSPYLQAPGFELYKPDGTKLNLSPVFNKTRTTPPNTPFNAGTVSVPFITVKCYPEDTNAIVTINGALLPYGQVYTHTFSGTGAVQFQVEIKSKKGNDNRSYAFKVTKS